MAQPGGPQCGSIQTPRAIQTHKYHVVNPLAASAQVPSFQSGDYVGADPAQGYSYGDHTAQDHGAPYQNYGDPVLYSEQFIDVNPPARASDFQQLQLAASTQNASSQTVTSQALTGQAHPSWAYNSPSYPAPDQFVSPHLIFGPLYARQPQTAGMNHANQGVLGDNTLGNPAADAAQDDPNLDVIRSYPDGGHEESHDNDGDLQM